MESDALFVFRYDRTFEGLLTVVFDAYSRKSFPERLIGPGEPVPMFAREVLDSTTDPVRAERVWKGLRKKLPRRLRNMLLHVWLSESVGADELLLRYMRKIFDSPERKSADFTDADVLAVHDIARTVSREAHHLIQFARLRKMADGSYYAPVSPKCNALPLAVGYFRDRFADQRWLVYDLKRRSVRAVDGRSARCRRACLPAFVEKLLRRAGDSRTVQSSLATPADARTVLEVSDRKGVTATPPCFVLSTRSAVLRVVFETTRRIRFCKTGAVWAVCGHCLEKGARFRIPLPGFDFCFRKTGGFSVLPTCGPLLWGTGSLAIVNAEILQSVKPIQRRTAVGRRPYVVAFRPATLRRKRGSRVR